MFHKLFLFFSDFFFVNLRLQLLINLSRYIINFLFLLLFLFLGSQRGVRCLSNTRIHSNLELQTLLTTFDTLGGIGYLLRLILGTGCWFEICCLHISRIFWWIYLLNIERRIIMKTIPVIYFVCIRLLVVGLLLVHRYIVKILFLKVIKIVLIRRWSWWWFLTILLLAGQLLIGRPKLLLLTSFFAHIFILSF